MSCSQLAVYSSEGLVRQRKLLEETRNSFLDKSQDHFPIRPIVHDSWVRCLQSSLDPRSKKTETPLNHEKIKKIIQSSDLYGYSIGTLKELLNHTQDTKYILTLCDSQGRIIFLEGDRQIKQQAETINFVLGSNWSEEVIGTNAIGTSLKTGYPVQIFAAEHYCEGIHDWVCSSSPIWNPITKELLGVIDITGSWKEAQSHTLGMTMMASRVIENKLNELAVKTRFQLMTRYSAVILSYPQDGVIVLDAAFNLVEANPSARQFSKHATGKDLGTLWTEQELHSHFRLQHNSVQAKDTYEVFIEQFGIPVLSQEIVHESKTIGFVLLLRSSSQNTIPKWPLQNDCWNKIVGRSGKILNAMTKCTKVAQANVPVLLIGESGSGKELFAKAIHQISDRRKGPFVAINCGAIPKELLASELFGYDPGTFTGAVKGGRKGKFEEANQGTLFLDEIGEMPLDFQVHLLRVLQEREVVRLGGVTPIPVDVKIISATHHKPEQLVNDGLFRADFYYRLQVVSIEIPPLRERRDDIPLLVDHFLEQLTHKYDNPSFKLDQQVQQFLFNVYPWPGNVRELQNCLEHAVLFCLNNTIRIDDLPHSIKMGFMNNSSSKINVPVTNLKPFNCQKEALLNLLQESGGNLSEAARELGVARTTLYRHLEKCGVRNMRDLMITSAK
ncbi:Fis family transcriptional regulator [Desulfosporosinus sp. HMP52]|uniref:sigma-54-dependent Fis family transcriptional regulator n=1 Tax=Desulfosporosinus sp. HMP52 TaxID=1487923 RepID=UPI00051F8B23|nr:sigma-54-dependent Fis family transcriptional regulator [Desulfosporosinus sp. HMP52]KGK86766.1 Fis family transcriptional regulator [Desulfosporosinus sp. HMP52]